MHNYEQKPNGFLGGSDGVSGPSYCSGWRLIQPDDPEDLVRLDPEHFSDLVLEDEPDTIAVLAPNLRKLLDVPVCVNDLVWLFCHTPPAVRIGVRPLWPSNWVYRKT